MLQWQPLVPLLVIGIVLTVVNMTRAWRLRGQSTAALYTLLMCVGMIEWSAVLAIGYSFDDLSIQTSFFLARYPGIALLVVGFLWFSRTLADPGRGPSRREVVLLSVVPVLITVVAATNSRHHLLLSATTLVGDPAFVSATPGPLFYVHMAYSYALLTLSWSHLIRAHRHGSFLHRRQITIVLLASLLPVAANLLSIVLSIGGGSPDFAVLAFTVAGLFFVRAMGQGLLSVVPLARASVMEQVSDGVVVLDSAGTILDANPAALDIARRIRPDLDGALVGLPWRRLLSKDVDQADELGDGEHRVAADGGEIDLDIRGTVLLDSRGRHLGKVRVIRDITTLIAQRRELGAANARLQDQLDTIEALRADLAALAVRDELTGLFNRRHLWSAMEEALVKARMTGGSMSVVLIDIDHFKQVNDTYGHGPGDRVLVEVAACLAGGTRVGDVVARYGGEEFVVLLSDASLPEAEIRAEALRAGCEQVTVDAGNGRITVTVSAGVATFPESGSDVAEIMQAADLALYRAKHAGRNRVVAAGPRSAALPQQSPVYSLPD